MLFVEPDQDEDHYIHMMLILREKEKWRRQQRRQEMKKMTNRRKKDHINKFILHLSMPLVCWLLSLFILFFFFLRKHKNIYHIFYHFWKLRWVQVGEILAHGGHIPTYLTVSIMVVDDLGIQGATESITMVLFCPKYSGFNIRRVNPPVFCVTVSELLMSPLVAVTVMKYECPGSRLVSW